MTAPLPAPARPAPRAPAARHAARTAGSTPRVLIQAGWREARWLIRSPLFLAGLAVSAWLIWLNNRLALSSSAGNYAIGPPNTVISWWAADVKLVACLLPVAGGALLAAQLAAGRSRRDGMEQLYGSYPATPATRSGALLLSAAGPVLLTAVLIAAGSAWISFQPVVGQPRWWVLAAGLLVVAVGSVLGTALGTWQPHPMAGLLAVLVLGLAEVDLSLSYTNPLHLSGGAEWQFPWANPGEVLTSLPGLIVPYPPLAHLAELAGLIVLAAAVALWRLAASRRGLAAVTAAALAVTVWAGWDQAGGVPAGTQAAIAAGITSPAGVQQCQSLQGVRYCYYPAFAPLARQWAAPVNGVLARVPAADRQGLTVRQVWDTNPFLAPLVAPENVTQLFRCAGCVAGRRVISFQTALAADPGLVPGSGPRPVYTDADWGTGTALGAAQLGLAVSTAEWATGLPTTGPDVPLSRLFPCISAGQARGAIAAWLAAGATPRAHAEFSRQTAPADTVVTPVGRSTVATVLLSGSGPFLLTGLLATAQQIALAKAMLALPAAHVEQVLAASWQSWMQPATTTAQLAAALGIPLPAQPAAHTASTGGDTPRSQLCN